MRLPADCSGQRERPSVSIAVVSYTTANTRAASFSNQSQSTDSLAEAGLNNALSVLSNPATNPSDSTLLPDAAHPRSDSDGNGWVSWYGSLSGNTGTITATGSARNPSGGAALKRTVTRIAQVIGSGGTFSSSWDRIDSGASGASCDTTVDGPVIAAEVQLPACETGQAGHLSAGTVHRPSRALEYRTMTTTLLRMTKVSLQTYESGAAPSGRESSGLWDNCFN